MKYKEKKVRKKEKRSLKERKRVLKGKKEIVHQKRERVKIKRVIVNKDKRKQRGGGNDFKKTQSITIVTSIISMVCKCIFYSNTEKTTI